MERDDLPALQAIFEDEPQRGLGDVTMASGRALQPISEGLHYGATNLLAKAMRALETADLARARALIARAVALPFDEHEGCAPAASAGDQILFELITDAIEESAADDSSWLDACLAVLEDAAPRARRILGSHLETVRNEYELSADERRRLDAAIRTVPDRRDLLDRELSEEELAGTLLELMTLCNALDAKIAGDWSG